jgi:hypothetical protein
VIQLAGFATLAYGLLTGMVASYGRPFQTSDAYGQLGGKWERFHGRPDLRAHHVKLLEMRDTLLANNDLTEHRAAVIWTRGAWHPDKAQPFESPINAQGIVEVRKLFAYQEERFLAGLQELANELQAILGWPDGREADLGLELERLGTDQTIEEFYATPRRRPEVSPLQDDSEIGAPRFELGTSSPPD